MAHCSPYVPHPIDAELARTPDGLPAKIVITGDQINCCTLAVLVGVFERQVIIDTLNRNAWHRINTARALGISRVTLFNKMRAYGLMGTDDGEAEGEVSP